MCNIENRLKSSNLNRDETDIFFMSEAIKEAKKSILSGDIPVGSLIVLENNIISASFNTREADKNPLGHAEINAIKLASQNISSKYLRNMTLYVTLEPCPMCTGAILESGIRRVVFGAYDPKGGACGTFMNLADYPGFSKRAIVKGGVMEKECREMLHNFFVNLRKSKK